MQARVPWSCKVHVKCVPYRQSTPTDCGATGTLLIATSWEHKVREGNITQEGVTHGTHTLSTRHTWNNHLHCGPDQPAGVSCGYWRITGLCPGAGRCGKAQVWRYPPPGRAGTPQPRPAPQRLLQPAKYREPYLQWPGALP